MTSASDLLGLLIIPTATAAAVAVLLRSLMPSAATRYILPCAIAAGYVAGSFLFPDRLPLAPERHWQWLPYLAIIAAVLGSVSAARGVRSFDRLLLFAVLGLVAAWLLVPGYADLQPTRPWSMLLLTCYLAGLAWLLALLPARLRGRLFFALLTLTAFATAVLVTSEVSLRIGAVALRGPLAMLGCQIVPRLFAQGSADHLPQELLAVIPVFAVLAGGSAFVGAIEFTEPRWLLLLAPAAPLMLWLFTFGPLARWQGKFAIAAQIIAVLLVPLAIFLWLLLPSQPNEWG